MRKFTVDRIYSTKRRAQQCVAYNAYMELFKAGLVNHHMLPLSSAIEPDHAEEVEAMLREVAKRAGTAQVSVQMDPWAVSRDEVSWFAHELVVEGLPALRLLTRSPLPVFASGDFPTLYAPGRRELAMALRAPAGTPVSEDEVRRAREWTYALFARIYGARMERDKHDFSYLFLPAGVWPNADSWNERRAWQRDRVAHGATLKGETALVANAAILGQRFSYPVDLALVRGVGRFDKPLRLQKWRFEPLTPEEEEKFREQYKANPELQITYPLMVVKELPKRRNFLIPFNDTDASTDRRPDALKENLPFLLHPEHALVELGSVEEIRYGLLLPSLLRWLSMALTAHNLRTELFLRSPVADVTLPLLVTAITAPAAQERFHYQRLETLGDTVLKFTASNQLYAQFPLWHEGYLSRKKDHAVANVNLARWAVKKGLYKWIIRDRFVPRKWKPHSPALPATPSSSEKEVEQILTTKENGKGKEQKKTAEELSTKMLADVVESLIGAAYEHGGFDLAIDCVERFDLGLSWKKLPQRVQAMHEVEDLADIPDQLALVEQMINYKFSRRTFLVQALTHASYQGDSAAMSLERLEFLGDAALDMIVVDYLYHAPGKNYSPGYMHIKKESVVNSHILAYFCLAASLPMESAMPSWSPAEGLTMVGETQRIHLWQCLLHSSHRVIEDQNLTFLRFQKHGAAIAHALAHDAIYPWAALTSLQAPKFLSDMVESLFGAVYIDSHGSLDAVRGVMRSLGLLGVLERVVLEDVDVLHPVSRLEIWAAQQRPEKKKVEYKLEKKKGRVSCAVVIDGEQVVKVDASYRTKVSEDEVRFTAAERANAMVRAQGVNVDLVSFEGGEPVLAGEGELAPEAEEVDGDIPRPRL